MKKARSTAQLILVCALGVNLLGCTQQLQALVNAMPIIPAIVPVSSSTFFTGSTYEENFRTVSVVQEPSVYSTTISGQTIVHVTYSSDEYCGENDCGVRNIVYRNSVDNFKGRVYVTKNSSVESISPKIVVKSDSTIVIVYSSKEYTINNYNIAYRTMSIGGADFSGKKDITTSALRDANNPSLGITTTDVVQLAYESQEYCDSNSCNYRSVALRSSADAFASRTDIGTDMVCHASHPFLAVQGGGSNVVHVLWNLQSNSSCAGGYVFRYAKSSNSFASPTLLNRVNQAPTFTVKNDGTAYIYYISTWPSVPVTCGGWQILSSNSSNNFATESSIQGSCNGVGYAGYNISPSLYVDANNIVHIAYVSGEGIWPQNTLVYRNSSDGFTAKTYLESSSFTPITYPAITVDSSGTKWIFAVTTGATSSGLNAYNSTNFTTRIPVSKSTFSGYGITRDNDGNFWLAILNQNYCSTHNCNQFNIEARALKTGALKQITKFTSGNVQLSTPRLVQYPTGLGSKQEIYYNSNEANANWMNFIKRSSADEFASPNYITNSTTAATTLGSRADPVLDKNLILRFPIDDGVNGWASIMDSSQWVSSRVSGMVSGYSNGGVGYIAVNPNNGEIGMTYHGNEAGSWGAKFRSNTNFTSFFSAPGTGGDSSMDFNPIDNDLYIAYPSTQALSGIFNITIRKRSDNFVSRKDPFLVFDNSTIGGCGAQWKWPIIFKIDESGVQHLVYTSREQNSNFCNVAYRNSLDWSKRRDISTLKNMDAGPTNLYLKSSAGPAVVCYATAYKATCQELPL